MATPEALAECRAAAEDVARTAGAVIRAAFSAEKRVETKSGSADLVTETDQRVEEIIIGTLRAKFPSHRFIGEESAAAGAKVELTDAETWIIDPLDGTTNFVHGFPFVAVSIGLAVRREVVLGVVYSCILDEMYVAVRGGGATLNGRPLRASSQTELSRALVATEFGSNRTPARLSAIRDNMHAVAAEPRPAHGIRCLGSAALNMCMVARGGCDAYFEFGIHCWDICAGVAIVREAGGVVVDPAGGPLDLMAQKVLCAGTGALAEAISATIQQIPVPRD